jgi:teichuronic acid exporter
MTSLQNKAVRGVAWSGLDQVSRQGIMFVVGVVLARLLTPAEFGLVGLTVFFLAITQVLVDSGFTQALIRRQHCTPSDYSTVLYFNLVLAALLYVALLAAAPAIASFFDEPALKAVLSVTGIVIVVNAAAIVQRAILTKRIDFRTQTRISISAAVLAGGLGIVLAIRGFGVWSLVWMMVLRDGLTTLLFWGWTTWRPTWTFDRVAFKEMFGFGYKLMLVGVIDQTYKNIFYVVIGKFFSPADLGQYTRAQQFSSLPSQSLTSIIQRVSYPLLSSVQDDRDRLRKAYRKVITSTMVLTLLCMLGMAAVARPVVLLLIGEQWLPAIDYLRILCVLGVFYPLHAINLNMLAVQGRSDIFLRLELIKKGLALLVIWVGIRYGIMAMLYAMVLNSCLAFLLNSFYSGRLIGYSTWQQVRDIFPSVGVTVTIAVVVHVAGLWLPTGLFVTLLLQVLLGAGLFLLMAESFQLGSYLFIKQLARENVASWRAKGD